jgi:ribosomal protein S18 acetylase RimI-like enzyme
MPSIRRGTIKDLSHIKQLARQAYQIYVDRIGKPPAPMIADFESSIDRGELFVSVEADQVCGYVVFYPTGRYMHLENVAVAPAYQGRGVGGALIAFVERQSAEQGLAGVELYTNEKMTENQRLYPALGYREQGRATEAGFNRVYYRKELLPVQRTGPVS